MPVTPLLGITFGVPDIGLRTGQAKLAFPYGLTSDYFWDIFRGSPTARPPSDPAPPPIDFGIPEVPVEVPQPVIYPSTYGGVSEVVPGSVGGGPYYPVVKTVVVEGVSTEVEQYEGGDFPAGSIFAPGRTWGATDDHGLDSEDPVVAIDWGGVVDWTLDTLSGQQAWQLPGAFQQQQPQQMSFGAPNYPVPAPSGKPGQPTTITGYTGGKAVTNGDTCGNRRYVTLDRETGKISCKRRRRRRLLTNRDLADLASLKTITGGGAALNAAVIRAVR